MNVTAPFKTKSMIISKDIPRIVGNNQFKGATIIALDGGYSAVKGMSPTRTFIFPSYAKKINASSQIIGELENTAILFRDNLTNTLWAVGSMAEAMLNRRDLDETTDQYLFDRYRYQTDVFRIIMSAGIGIGLLDTSLSNDIYLQTGLPATYKNDDSEELKQVLAGHYDFDIKVGNAEFVHFDFTLEKDRIDVIEQPQGALLSAIYDKNLNPIPEKIAMLKSNVIIYDIGFGTEDLFIVKHGMNDGHQTYSDTGMRAVFEDLIQDINAKHHTNFKIFEFQKFLDTGKAVYFDRESFGSAEVDFAAQLLESNKKIARKSIQRLMQEQDNLMDYRYLIVTGGTGESRFDLITKTLAGLTSLTVVAGNENDPSLPFSFSNVRGYYIFAYLRLKKERK